MNYAGHQAHFLERLSRIDEEQTAFAMSLYCDAEFVSRVLERVEIPADFERVAIAIGAEGAGPYVVLTREGYFVTCLGERMKPRGLYVIAREKVEPLLGMRQASRESERRMEESGWSPRTPWKVLRRREAALTREDFERLQEIRPLMMREMLPEFFELPGDLSNTRRALEVRFGRKLTRFRPDEEKVVRNYWGSFFQLHHLSVLLASDFEKLTRFVGREMLVPIFGDLPMWSWREGMYGPNLRALWCAGQLGPFMKDYYLERLQSPATFHDSFLWLGACLITAFREPSFRRPLLMVLRDWQYKTDAIPEEKYTHTERHQMLLSRMGLSILLLPKKMEENFMRCWASDYLGHGWCEKGLIEPLEGVAEKLRRELVEDTSAEEAVTLSINNLQEMRNEPLWVYFALSTIPALARMSARDLFSPADMMSDLEGWNPEVALELFQRHVETRYVSEPVRVEESPGRNDPCSCGSGRKYKRCCLKKRSRMEGMEV